LKGEKGLKRLSIGIIGLGEVGKKHLDNAIHLKSISSISVADVSKNSLHFAKERGVKKTYDNYEELLKDPQVDCVVISLPTFLHMQASVEAAEHGKHILLEKPLARNIVEAEKTVSAAKMSGVKLMVGYPLRFFDPFTKLKEEIDLGRMGDVQIAIASHISTGPFAQRTETTHTPKPVPSWWLDKELTGGGSLIDLGCHLVNLLRWYFGKVIDVKCHLGHRFNLDFEDFASCILKFQSGTVAVLNVGWFSRYHKVQVDLYGTVESASAASRPPRPFDYVKNLLAFDTSTGFYKELQYFVDCVNSDTAPTPSGEDGAEDLKVISDAYEHVTLRELPR
jgi:predicted dehydrogenase